MVVDDARKLLDKYTDITNLLDDWFDDEYPTTDSYELGREIQLYYGKCHIDPWQFIVECELKANKILPISDLVVYNIVNDALHGDSSKCMVFEIDDKLFASAISYEMFLACCFMLNSSVRKARACWKDPFSWTPRAPNAKFALKLLSKIDVVQPLFLAKLFTKDVKKFMACIEFSHSEALPAFIVKSFIQKTPLDKMMFRKVISLFKQEMTKMTAMNIFMK